MNTAAFPYTPVMTKTDDASTINPLDMVVQEVGTEYSVRVANKEYPITVRISNLNPYFNMCNNCFGVVRCRHIIAALAARDHINRTTAEKTATRTA